MATGMATEITTAKRPQTTVSCAQKPNPQQVHVLTKAFLTDPVFTYLLNHVPFYHRVTATYHIIRLQLLFGAHKSRSLFYAAASPTDATTTLSPQETTEKPQCAMAVLCPGHELMEPGFLGWMKVLASGFHKVFYYAGMKPWKAYLSEYGTAVERAKSHTFSAGEDYYYIFFVGTDEKHRGKGLAGGAIADLLVRAQKEMKPVWLEASNPGARRVYERCGFRDVSLSGDEMVEMRIGVGEVDEYGEKARGEDAVGVPVFPMVWFPEGYEKVKGRSDG